MARCFTFESGTAIFRNSSGVVLFTDGIVPRNLAGLCVQCDIIDSPTSLNGIPTGSSSLTVGASLVPIHGVFTGGILSFGGTRTGNVLEGVATGILGGFSGSLPTVVPEPGTLSLLGTGLIGLAGLARRKLKL